MVVAAAEGASSIAAEEASFSVAVASFVAAEGASSTVVEDSSSEDYREACLVCHPTSVVDVFASVAFVSAAFVASSLDQICSR